MICKLPGYTDKRNCFNDDKIALPLPLNCEFLELLWIKWMDLRLFHRHKVVKMHRFGKGYKIISKCLCSLPSEHSWINNQEMEAAKKRLSFKTQRFNKKETSERNHREPNNHFEGATEFSVWEWRNGAPVNHIKSTLSCVGG